MSPFPLEPTPLRVSDEVLDDLRRRLTMTKWPLDAGNEDGYYGVRRSYLQKLVAYWADGNLPPEIHSRIVSLEKRFAVHLAAHVLAPTTLGYGLADSPAGMLAWILERWANWCDGDIETVFTMDDLLTHATIYWAGSAIDTSIRTYANNNRYPWTPSHDRWPVVEAPTGITFVGYENPPGVKTSAERVENFLASDLAAWYNHVNITAHDHDGHFIPWEVPGEWVEDLRRTFHGRQ